MLRRDFGKFGPGAKWGLENSFSKHGYNFGRNEPRDPNFFFKCRTLKNIRHVSRGFPKFGPGALWGLENCYILSIAKTFEGMNLETPNFFKRVEHQKIFDTCLGAFQNLN